jgi:hypothetical protein
MKYADTGPIVEQMPHLATKDFKTYRYMSQQNSCRNACMVRLHVPNGLIRIKMYSSEVESFLCRLDRFRKDCSRQANMLVGTTGSSYRTDIRYYKGRILLDQMKFLSVLSLADLQRYGNSYPQHSEDTIMEC